MMLCSYIFMCMYVIVVDARIVSNGSFTYGHYYDMIPFVRPYFFCCIDMKKASILLDFKQDICQGL